MGKITEMDSLGARIVSAARMAVATHLEFARNHDQGLQRMLLQTVRIGGTDRRVTDDIEETMDDEGSL